MIDLESLRDEALARIQSARTPEDLEAVRVEVLGRKGALASVSKEFGKLTPEDRVRIGKDLNAAKQSLEEAFESKKAGFEQAALDVRLAGEWLDLTIPASGTRPGSLHPLTQIQRDIGCAQLIDFADS